MRRATKPKFQQERYGVAARKPVQALRDVSSCSMRNEGEGPGP